MPSSEPLNNYLPCKPDSEKLSRFVLVAKDSIAHYLQYIFRLQCPYPDTGRCRKTETIRWEYQGFDDTAYIRSARPGNRDSGGPLALQFKLTDSSRFVTFNPAVVVGEQ